MKKISVSVVVVLSCALALVSPGAAATPRPTVGPPSATHGAEATETGPGPGLAPAADPVIRAEALGPLTSPDAGPSAPAPVAVPVPTAAPPGAAPPPGPPQPPSIPPLTASASDLPALTQTKQPSPLSGTGSGAGAGAAAGTGYPRPASEALQSQALVRDNATAQINAVFNAINSYRASLGLAAVKYHATVAAMAQEWSDSIASREVIEHRSSFWTDSRALNPSGAGEVIAVRWDRDAAQLVEWWKGSPAHNAILTDPRFKVVGIGITFTDGNWQTSPNRYAMWGVVDFFGYDALPAGTTASPGGSTLPAQPASVCDPLVKHMPPTVDLAAASIKSAGDLVSVDTAGQLVGRASVGNRQYGTQRVIGTGFGSVKELFVTDWERDGVFDVLAQWTDGRVTLHSGRAGGGFLPAVTLGKSGWEGMTLALGGWCTNNRLPQLLALDGAGNLWLYPNRGAGDLAERTLIASGVSANRLAMVDYDADGFQDLLARQADGTVRLYRGSGTPEPRAETRTVVASGWSDVTAIRPLRDVTGLNSTGLALRRGGDTVQYWDLGSGSLASPSYVPGSWAGLRLAQ